MKKFIIIILIFLLFPSFAYAAEGQNLDSNKVIETLGNNTVIQFYPNLTYIILYSSSIDYYGNNSLMGSARTVTADYVDRLYVKITLQRYENGRWVNVDSATKTSYNTKSIDLQHMFSATRGRIYRVATTHKATKATITETQINFSNKLQIN